MKVGLLECDHVAERFRHHAGDYREMFATLWARSAPEVELHPFDVCNHQFPAEITDCDAYVCTGSRFSVYDDVVWIHTLKDFVRQLHAAEHPFVGICFGHQMLAEALGGKVARAEIGWGVGVRAIEITQAESWMQPLQTSCHLQYMHQDQVQQLPADGLVLGQSTHCPVALLRVGRSMLGIQAHPEFTPEYGEALLVDRTEKIGAERTRQARESLSQATDEIVVTRWLTEFLKQALTQS